MVLVRTRDGLARVLTIDDATAVIGNAFRELAEGMVEMPLRASLRSRDPFGTIHVILAFFYGMEATGLKVVSYYPSNRSKFGIPAIEATVLYNDARSGRVLGYERYLHHRYEHSYGKWDSDEVSGEKTSLEV